MNFKTEKIYAFIDSQNLNLSVLKDIEKEKTGELIYRGWKLDFKKFYIWLNTWVTYRIS